MLVKCQVARIIHSNENFQLVACMPIGDFPHGLAIHPTYHTFTVKDTDHRLIVDKIYTINVDEQPPTKYGIQYLLIDIPSLSFNDVADITDDMEYELLQEIMTETQANYVHEAYPDFIRKILLGQTDEINVKKIYNVSNKRFNTYVRKIDKRYTSFILRGKFRGYQLTPQECSTLFGIYTTLERVEQMLTSHPYMCLYQICNRPFRCTDNQIMSVNTDMKFSDERLEYMVDYAITQFENEGSTYVDAVRMAEYVRSIDADVLEYLPNIVNKSDLLKYEADRNIVQRFVTYRQEKNIAHFFKDIIRRSNTLDWDWQKYTKIKDGELTEEQQNVLKTFCESNVVILDAPAGCGKTATMLPLINMIEDYGMTYQMMSPTGKAASRLSDQTGRPASTIHRALLSGMLYDKDVLIIDEASMLSIPLLDSIISSELLNNVRFLFVGDSSQIPSIGLGRVFKDMGESGIVPTCTLTKCFRFEEGGASYISTLTRQGKFYMTNEQQEMDRFTLGKKSDYEFIKFNGTVDQIVDTYMELIMDGVKPKDIMLLVPYNIGGYGATKLNNLIQEQLNPVGNDNFMKTTHNDTAVIIHRNDLVMNIQNNYHAISYKGYKNADWDDCVDTDDLDTTSVFNGQVGYVEDVMYDSGLINGKMLVANIEGEDIVYTTGEINNLLLGYASNPYRFQGSQCPYIINLVLPAHERSFNKNLLYTAQTRMTKKLIEIGDIETMKKAVYTNGYDNRMTRLKEFLTETP